MGLNDIIHGIQSKDRAKSFLPYKEADQRVGATTNNNPSLVLASLQYLVLLVLVGWNDKTAKSLQQNLQWRMTVMTTKHPIWYV